MSVKCGFTVDLATLKMGKLQDKGKLGKLGEFHVQVCSGNVHAIYIVIVAPPIVMGAWSMLYTGYIIYNALAVVGRSAM